MDGGPLDASRDAAPDVVLEEEQDEQRDEVLYEKQDESDWNPTGSRPLHNDRKPRDGLCKVAQAPRAQIHNNSAAVLRCEIAVVFQLHSYQKGLCHRRTCKRRLQTVPPEHEHHCNGFQLQASGLPRAWLHQEPRHASGLLQA